MPLDEMTNDRQRKTVFVSNKKKIEQIKFCILMMIKRCFEIR